MSAGDDLGHDLARLLAGLIGQNRVVDLAGVAQYAIGSFIPLAVAVPSETEEVATVMEWAHQHDVAVYPAGGRTLTQLGNLPTRPGIALDMTGLNRILDFQPADLTVRVQAGISVESLDSALAQDGKMVPLSPPLSGRATVGGTLATGISGPMRATYGLPRDWLIGISMIGADGVPSKAGGQVVKNVTGYDLNRLYVGSLGTLGVITEATFKVTPAPTDWGAVIAAFPNNEAAAAACRNLMSQPFAPQGLCILNPAAARRMGHSEVPGGYGPVAIALIAGRPASVRRRIEETALAWLNVGNTFHIAGQEAMELTETLADFPVNPDDPPTVCVRLNAPPIALERLLMMDDMDLDGEGPGVVADVGFGGGRVMWWNDLSAEDPGKIAERLRQIQTAATDLGGGSIVETCPLKAKELIDVWGPMPSGMEIMRRIKQQFDPKGVLNPGRYIGGL